LAVLVQGFEEEARWMAKVIACAPGTSAPPPAAMPSATATATGAVTATAPAQMTREELRLKRLERFEKRS